MINLPASLENKPADFPIVLTSYGSSLKQAKFYFANNLIILEIYLTVLTKILFRFHNNVVLGVIK